MRKIVLVLAVMIVCVASVFAIDWRYDRDKTDATNNTVQTLIDEVSDVLTYIGRARSGKATSEAAWQVYRVSIDGTVTSIQFYSGDASYNAIWDARAAGVYK